MWMNLNPAMLAWIPRIKQAGFRLGILSNMGYGVLVYMLPPFPGWQFDHLTWSCELGPGQARSGHLPAHRQETKRFARSGPVHRQPGKEHRRRGGSRTPRGSLSERRAAAERSGSPRISPTRPREAAATVSHLLPAVATDLNRKWGGGGGTRGSLFPNAKAGCPIQAVFWLEWDTAALTCPFL